MARVYVSSTWEDLVPYRAEVAAALRRLKHEVVSMEDYTARPGRPLDECLADVRSCDVLVGIVAWRQGFVPHGRTESIAQLELLEAERTHKIVLPFLLHDDQPWPPGSIDDDKAAIVRWRERLRRDYVVSFFRTPPDLANLVTAAVTNALAPAGAGAPAPGLSAERRRFLCDCLRNHLRDLGVRNREYVLLAGGLALAGVIALAAGLFAFEAEKAAVVGAGSLLPFSAAVVPLVPLFGARNKMSLLSVCMSDLESEHPSPDSVGFAVRLLDQVISK